MSELTAQSIFDTVVEHFKAQKVRAYDEQRKFCLYRAPEGRKCAVGILITDEEYTEKMDRGITGGDVSGLLNNGLLPERLRPFASNEDYDDTSGLLNRLQRIHDTDAKAPLQLVDPVVARALRMVARDFNLDASKVDW